MTVNLANNINKIRFLLREQIEEPQTPSQIDGKTYRLYLLFVSLSLSVFVCLSLRPDIIATVDWA